MGNTLNIGATMTINSRSVLEEVEKMFSEPLPSSSFSNNNNEDDDQVSQGKKNFRKNFFLNIKNQKNNYKYLRIYKI